MSEVDLHPQLILVRFEQGRGKTGVPKEWVAYLEGHPNDPAKKPELATLVRKAVQLFRAACVDANLGHGRDLMPGRDDEYELHNLDGGRLEKVEDIRWEPVPLMPGSPGTVQRAELVLTWRSPADLLLGG